MLDKTRVAEAIEKKKAERSKRTGITADRVLQEYAKIAFANADDIIDFTTGRVLNSATKEDLAAIQSVKVKESSRKCRHRGKRSKIV